MLLLHSTCQQIWKTQQWPQDWKRSVFIPIPKKRNAKECSNYHTIVLISQTSKIMLKIHQARLQQYMNWELPDVQPGFRKGRGTRYQTANIRWIIEKAREFQKNIYFCFTDYAKPLTVWITTNCGKFFKKWEYQTFLLRNLYAGYEATIRTRHGTTTDSKLWKEYISAHLIYMQSTSWEMLGWMKHKLESVVVPCLVLIVAS